MTTLEWAILILLIVSMPGLMVLGYWLGYEGTTKVLDWWDRR